MFDRIIGPFFFSDNTVTRSVYFYILEQFVVTKLEKMQPKIMFQQNGVFYLTGDCASDDLLIRYL